MNKDYLPLLVALGSGLLGVIISNIAQAVKAKKEDNRKRKEALFFLLEFRSLIPRFNLAPALQWYAEKLVRRFPVEYQSPQAVEFVAELISPFMASLVRDMLKSHYEELKIGFRTTIKNLSAVDPLLAFRLNGKESILKQTDVLKTNINSVVDNEATQGQKNNTEKIKKHLFARLDEKFFSDSIEGIEDLIFEISTKIYVINGKQRINKVLNRIDSKPLEEDEEINRELDEYFDLIDFSSLNQAQNAPMASN